MKRRSGHAAVGLAAWLAFPALATAAPADLVLYNGKVLTVDGAFSIRSALAVKDGRIIAVGGEEIRRDYQAPVTTDLEGRVLMPGFTDTHLHVNPVSRRQVPSEAARSIPELQAMLRKKAAELGPGEWITGYGWDEALLAEKRNPTRADIDAATPDNPVMLVRSGRHSAVGNSRALQLAGIDRNTPDPKSGIIEHGPDGEPNGIIRERGDLYSKHIPPDTYADLKQSFADGMKQLLALGITSYHNANNTIDDEPIGKGGVADPNPELLTPRRVRELMKENDYRLPRATLYINFPGEARLKAFGQHSGQGDEWVRLGGIGENGVDGGFTGPTAWTLADYKNQPGFRGKGRFTDAELQAMVDTSNRYGWQMALHAIGDAAIVQTVNAYAASLKKMPRKDHRWFLDHFTIMPPDETMRTMKRYGIAIAQQPNFLYLLEGRYEETLDDWRLAHNNSVATPLRRFGLEVSFGTDIGDHDPRVGLYAAVTRKGRSGRVHGPEEAVPIREAIRLYTATAAYLSWEEKIKGTLEPGKLADFIVLDSDPLTIPPEQLLTMKVDQTYLGGRLVYDRATARP